MSGRSHRINPVHQQETYYTQDQPGILKLQKISSKLSNWWSAHHRGGGLVWYVPNVLDLVQSPEQYVNQLFDRYRKLSFQQVLDFSESEVTDNSMPDREVLEDGSKIHMLRHAYRNGGLAFNVQLLHEPWYDRWRVHPGSGRLAAMWLEDQRRIPGIHIHFNTSRPRTYWHLDRIQLEERPGPTPDSHIINTAAYFLDCISCQTRVTPDFETYYAFPNKSKDCHLTQQMDLEWHWHYIKNQSYVDWKFLRWSEGKNFLEHKYTWRSYAIELWHELNR